MECETKLPDNSVFADLSDQGTRVPAPAQAPRTQKQIDAARANGAKSQGPVTPDGRARSARNAVKHGFYSSDVVLVTEDQGAYDRLLDGYLETYRPAGVPEFDLVLEMVNARWRLRRMQAIETAMINMDIFIQKPVLEQVFDKVTPVMRAADAFMMIAMGNPVALDKNLRMQRSYERAFERALRQLVALQKARQSAAASEPENLQNEPEDCRLPDTLVPAELNNSQNEPGEPPPSDEPPSPEHENSQNEPEPPRPIRLSNFRDDDDDTIFAEFKPTRLRPGGPSRTWRGDDPPAGEGGA